MGKGRLKLLSTIPGSRNLAEIVRRFSKGSGGVITSFSDGMIRPLASMIPEDSEVEALQFGSLARRCATFCGEMPPPVAQEGHVVAAIGAACEDLPSGSPFAASGRFGGLHKALAETLHELAAWNFDTDELEVLAARADPPLASKLRSIAHIEREVTETLRMVGRTLTRENFRICEGSRPEKGADLGRILVIAGDEAPPNALRLIAWAVKNGARVTVVTYRAVGAKDLFAGARSVEAELAEPELLSIGDEGDQSRQLGSVTPLLGTLFTSSVASEKKPNCVIASAPDPLSEAEWALRSALAKHGKGIPYSSLALYVRDLPSYAPLLESAAKRLGVPLALARRAPLLTNSFARLTLGALEFCASRDVRSLLPLARTTYVGLKREQFVALEAALKEAHSTRGAQWQTIEAWASNNVGFEWLMKLLAWRNEALANPTPLEQWIGQLRALMGNLPWESNPAGRARDVRAQYVLWQSLTNVASVRRLRGPRSLTLAEFVLKAKEIWDDADVSVPATDNGIVVSADAELLPDAQAVFVLGMLEGVFPRRRSEDPVLSDEERLELSRIRGGPRLLTSREKANRERDEFYSVCASATDELIFSYPETDEDRDNVPAFYLEEIDRAIGGAERITYRRKQWTPDAAVCLSSSDKSLAEALLVERLDPDPPMFENGTTVHTFAVDAAKARSPRELREALQCPFQFFVRRVLDVKPERFRTRWFSLIKLPQAAGLMRQETPQEAAGALTSALEAELDSLHSELPEWERGLLRSGGTRLIREWVEREFTARDVWPREDTRSDALFGDHGLRTDLVKGASISGKVAGLSRLGRYNVVHLLETSPPTVTEGGFTRMNDQDTLYYGLHLMAAYTKGSASAVEVETMAGERVLLLLPRLAGHSLPARVQEGLKVVDLGVGDLGSTKEFYGEVKNHLNQALERIKAVDVRPLRGDHCAWCDYGELCRQSQDFGEEASPFVEGL